MMLEPNKQEAEEAEEGLITEDDLGLKPQTSQASRRHHYIRVGAIIGGILVCMGMLVVIAMVVHHYEKSAYDGPAVVLISLDGFRWDYLLRNLTPNMQQLISRGVYAPSVFPTKTFPNHYSIITGLYAESHGIIANTFYDPVFNETFRAFGCSTCNQDAKWWGGEPLWVTAEKQDVRAATLFWPGSEAPIGGMRPTYWLPYNQNMKFDARVAEVMSWMSKPQGERPRFVTLYLELVDSMGHEHGPDSPEVNAAITEVDATIGSLMRQLEASGLAKDTSIIVVADHGMTQDSDQRVIFLDDYIDMRAISIIDWSPVLTFLPLVPQEQIYDALYNAHPNLTVYYKEDIPEGYHYKDNRRVTPIIGVADLGWEIAVRTHFNPAAYNGGNHGFDPAYMDMKAIFLASGPAFKTAKQIAPIANTQVYNIICKVLTLDPAPNNGTSPLPDMFA